MKTDELYISDIKQQADFILEILPKISRDELIESMLYQNALIRSLEVIGEAAKRLSAEFLAAHPEIPIREMARTRDKLIHGYADIDLDKLWMIVSVDIPRLAEQLEELE